MTVVYFKMQFPVVGSVSKYLKFAQSSQDLLSHWTLRVCLPFCWQDKNIQLSVSSFTSGSTRSFFCRIQNRSYRMPSPTYQDVINLTESVHCKYKNIYECSDVGLLTIMTLDVDKLTALTLLSLWTALKIASRIVGFKMFPLQFYIEIAQKIFLWYFRKNNQMPALLLQSKYLCLWSNEVTLKRV